jgi:predicted  nucleic acid-binding Zn-ribbon protein
MTHSDLTELQIEISELEKENQELKDRVKDLEVNLTYLTNQIDEGKPKAVAGGAETLSLVH